MKTIAKILKSPWTAAFSFTAGSLGFLVDVVTGWGYVSHYVDRVFPLVADQNVYLLFLGVVVVLGVLRGGYLTAGLLIDKKRGIPEIRTFSEIQSRVRRCRTLLEQVMPPKGLFFLGFELEKHLAETTFELNRLQVDLNALGIGTPTIDESDISSFQYSIAYLVTIEGYARYEDLEGARREFPLLPPVQDSEVD